MYSLPLEPLLQCSPFIRKQSPQSLSWATAIQQRSPLPLWRCRLPFSLSFFSLSAQQAESVCSAKPVHSTRCLLINKLEFKSAAKSFTTSSHKSGGMQWQKIYHFSEMTINYFDCHNIKGQHQTESKVFKKKKKFNKDVQNIQAYSGITHIWALMLMQSSSEIDILSQSLVAHLHPESTPFGVKGFNVPVM